MRLRIIGLLSAVLLIAGCTSNPTTPGLQKARYSIAIDSVSSQNFTPFSVTVNDPTRPVVRYYWSSGFDPAQGFIPADSIRRKLTASFQLINGTSGFGNSAAGTDTMYLPFEYNYLTFFIFNADSSVTDLQNVTVRNRMFDGNDLYLRFRASASANPGRYSSNIAPLLYDAYYVTNPKYKYPDPFTVLYDTNFTCFNGFIYVRDSSGFDSLDRFGVCSTTRVPVSDTLFFCTSGCTSGGCIPPSTIAKIFDKPWIVSIVSDYGHAIWSLN